MSELPALWREVTTTDSSSSGRRFSKRKKKKTSALSLPISLFKKKSKTTRELQKRKNVPTYSLLSSSLPVCSGVLFSVVCYSAKRIVCYIVVFVVVVVCVGRVSSAWCVVFGRVVCFVQVCRRAVKKEQRLSSLV